MIIGVDGMPHSLLESRMREGRFPNFQQLLAEGDMSRMSSVAPTVSSVAWTTIMTGKNPAGHNVFGFVDRKPETMEMFIPTAADRRAPTLWDVLGEHGKYSVVMNVPCTYPPRQMNGKLVSCFLATDINKATYPPALAEMLKGLGYVIDVDPWKARTDKDGFMDDLFNALERRLEATLMLMENEPWDLFATHIMETDRLFHFFWGDMEDGHPVYAERGEKFLDRVDDFIGEVRARMPEGARLIALSDHGFCRVKKDVFVNRALHDAGLLKYNCANPKELGHIAPESKAYSMIPGRVFVNLKGREKSGSVEKGGEYDEIRARVKEILLSLKDEDGSGIVDKVFMREEIYSGEFIGAAADVIAMPCDGYDLKGAIFRDVFAAKSDMQGTHTYHDAFFYASGQVIGKSDLNIVDVLPSVLSLFGIARPGLDGACCFL